MNNPQEISIAIIGHRGRMGGMLAKQLGKQGFVVKGADLSPKGSKSKTATRTNAKALSVPSSMPMAHVFDTPVDANSSDRPTACDASDRPANSAYATQLAQAVSSSQVVLLCVPVGALTSALEEIHHLLRPEHLLMDITSVKCFPMATMERFFSGAVVGAHPLFGPTPRPEDKRTILVQGKNASSHHCLLAEYIFTSLQSTIHWATAEEHDKGVAIAQTLNFTVSAAFFSTLAKEENIQHFLTPSFKRHLEAARKHLTQDTAMFLEFSAMNPFFNEAITSYEATLGRITKGELPLVAKEAQQWYARNELL